MLVHPPTDLTIVLVRYQSCCTTEASIIVLTGCLLDAALLLLVHTLALWLEFRPDALLGERLQHSPLLSQSSWVQAHSASARHMSGTCPEACPGIFRSQTIDCTTLPVFSVCFLQCPHTGCVGQPRMA